MKESKTPKGVKFSFFMMTFPLLCTTGYLGLITPLVTLGSMDPQSFAYVARTSVRLLALNISFIVIKAYLIYLIGRYSLWASSCNI